MEPAELVVTALAAGAAGGAENVVSTAVKDAYLELKQLLAARFTGKMTAKIALAEHKNDPQTWRAPLEKALGDTGAYTDREVIAAAQRLMALLDEPGSIGGKYTVTVHDSQGTQIGDEGFQANLFPSHSTVHPDPAVHEAADGTPHPGAGLPEAFQPITPEGLVPTRPGPGRLEPDSGSGPFSPVTR
jgi:hypothetical protein